MTLLGKILAFLKRLPGDLLWFTFAPRDWDAEFEEIKAVKSWE